MNKIIIEVYGEDDQWFWQVDLNPPKKLILSPEESFPGKNSATANAKLTWLTLGFPGFPEIVYTDLKGERL